MDNRRMETMGPDFGVTRAVGESDAREYCPKCMGRLVGDGVCPNCGPLDNTPPDPQHLAPGTVLDGRYLVGRSLGQGGFGITYLGRDLVLDVPIAIKEYYPHVFASRNTWSSNEVSATGDKNAPFFEKGKKRFLEEARVMARYIKQSGIVDVMNYFEANGTAYIVMDYLDGVDLRHALEERGTFSAGWVFESFAPILDALEYLHADNVFHRDISPDNIMLLKDGSLRLMDFGASRQKIEGTPLTTAVMYKSGYAPEEQYTIDGDQGAWTDIYALCATMYKCITGVTPADALHRLSGAEVVPPSRMGVAISPGHEYVILRGMSLRASDRFQSIAQMRAAIEIAEGRCPSCGGAVRFGDSFCGKCRAEISLPALVGAEGEGPVASPSPAGGSMHLEVPPRREHATPRPAGTVASRPAGGGASRSARTVAPHPAGGGAPRPVGTGPSRPAMRTVRPVTPPVSAAPARPSNVPYIVAAIAVALAAFILVFGLLNPSDASNRVVSSSSSVTGVSSASSGDAAAENEDEGSDSGAEAGGADEDEDADDGFDVEEDSGADTVVVEDAEEPEIGNKLDMGDSIAYKSGLGDYSWSELSAISEEIGAASDEADAIDVARRYNLVDADGRLNPNQVKEVDIGGVTYSVHIIGFYHDEKSSGGMSGITLQFTRDIDGLAMNDSLTSDEDYARYAARRNASLDKVRAEHPFSVPTNDGGWEDSDMRAWLNGYFLSGLPSDLRESIVAVEKRTNNVGETSSVDSVTATSDMVWLLSKPEVVGPAQCSSKVTRAEGSKYQLFEEAFSDGDSSPTLQRKPAGSNTPEGWWLRTPAPQTFVHFAYVTAEGATSATFADTVYGVAPCFCI